MTVRERDSITKKIVNAIMKDLEEESELGLMGDNWDDEDQEETRKRWEQIVKRFILVDKNDKK